MKNILKKEITKADTEINRDQTIIKEYKQVNSYKISTDITVFPVSTSITVFFSGM